MLGRNFPKPSIMDPCKLFWETGLSWTDLVLSVNLHCSSSIYQKQESIIKVITQRILSAPLSNVYQAPVLLHLNTIQSQSLSIINILPIWGILPVCIYKMPFWTKFCTQVTTEIFPNKFLQIRLQYFSPNDHDLVHTGYTPTKIRCYINRIEFAETKQ